MAASRKGINRIAKIDPKTDPISVGPSLMLFCMALPRYEPIAMLINTTKVNVIPFSSVDS
jgi:hypothetical protein